MDGLIMRNSSLLLSVTDNVTEAMLPARCNSFNPAPCGHLCFSKHREVS